MGHHRIDPKAWRERVEKELLLIICDDADGIYFSEYNFCVTGSFFKHISQKLNYIVLIIFNWSFVAEK